MRIPVSFEPPPQNSPPPFQCLVGARAPHARARAAAGSAPLLSRRWARRLASRAAALDRRLADADSGFVRAAAPELSAAVPVDGVLDGELDVVERLDEDAEAVVAGEHAAADELAGRSGDARVGRHVERRRDEGGAVLAEETQAD